MKSLPTGLTVTRASSYFYCGPIQVCKLCCDEVTPYGLTVTRASSYSTVVQYRCKEALMEG